MRASSLIVPLVAALSFGACVRPFATRTSGGGVLQPASPPTRMPRERPADSTALPAGVARKVVSGKRDPNVLIAIDGALCTVSEQRYRDVRYGDRIWCAWRSGAADR